MKNLTKNYFIHSLVICSIICLDFILVNSLNAFISVFIINSLLILPIIAIYSSNIFLENETKLVIKNLFITLGIINLQEENIYIKIYEIKKFKFLTIKFLTIECKNTDRIFKIFCKNTEEVMKDIVKLGNE